MNPINVAACISPLLLVCPATMAAAPVLEIVVARSVSGPAVTPVRLSAEQFRALPQTHMTTSTSWTPAATFTGVKLASLMKLAGAKGQFVQVHALDDYAMRIPVADFTRYGIILAHSMNGKSLETSRFGPYFIIYPKDKFPQELGTPTSEAKFVWQVSRLVFE